MVLRARKQHQRADVADAVEALVDQVREAGAYLREGAELPAADANLRADEPFEPAPAVLGLQRQGRIPESTSRQSFGKKLSSPSTASQRESSIRDAAAEPGVGIPRIADAKGRELAADFQAARVGLRKRRTRGKTNGERDRCDSHSLPAEAVKPRMRKEKEQGLH